MSLKSKNFDLHNKSQITHDQIVIIELMTFVEIFYL